MNPNSPVASSFITSSTHQRRNSGLTELEENEAKDAFSKYKTRVGRLPFARLEEALEEIQIRYAGHELRTLLGRNPEWEKEGLSESQFLELAGKSRSQNVATPAALKPLGSTMAMSGASSDVYHSIRDVETISFSEWINNVLKDDEYLTSSNVLPLNPKSGDLFEKCKDGILLSKLVNVHVPGTIDESKLNLVGASPHSKLPQKERIHGHENNSLLLDGCREIGCVVVNIHPNELVEGKKHLIMGLIWQIIRIGLLANLKLNQNPKLKKLIRAEETDEKLDQIAAENVLIRWVNYHMQRSNSTRRLSNFTDDIKDSEIYTHLLHQIAPRSARVTLAPLKLDDPVARASAMLDEAEKIGCKQFVHPEDVVEGNYKLNLAFVANLFNSYTSLEDRIVPEEKDGWAALLKEGETLADLRKMDPETFLVRWINHQLETGKDPRRIKNLTIDVQDGQVYARVARVVLPKSATAGIDPKEQNKATLITQIVDGAEKAGVNFQKKVNVADVVAGQPDANREFVTQLYNEYPNLEKYQKYDIEHPPEAEKLLKKQESKDFILNYNLREYLMRWVNYHLSRSQCNGKLKRMTNYTEDLVDSEIYMHLIKQIGALKSSATKPNPVTLSPLRENDLKVRAEKTIKEAAKIQKGPTSILPDDIVRGDGNKNFEFLLEIYKQNHSLAEKVFVVYPRGASKLLLLSETSTNEVPIEILLTRWVNYHLEKSGTKRRLTNFTKDLEDSEIYTRLLHQIAPKDAKVTLEPLNHKDFTKRATHMIREASRLSCGEFIQPQHVVGGKDKHANVQFIAELLNKTRAI